MLRLTHDMMTMMTPTTKGWRSDDPIILSGWSVTLVGPGQYPRYTSAVKDGKPWVAQRLTKPPSTTTTRQQHDLHQNFLNTVLQSIEESCRFLGGTRVEPCITGCFLRPGLYHSGTLFMKKNMRNHLRPKHRHRIDNVTCSVPQHPTKKTEILKKDSE